MHLRDIRPWQHDHTFRQDQIRPGERRTLIVVVLTAVMGVVGAILVARWSWGLMRDSGRVLLDRQAPPHVLAALREATESQVGNRIADLHVWSVGPGIHAAEISVVADDPQSPDHYKNPLPKNLGLLHVTVEVHPCRD
jgi:Co/Zn/Cd efflux system component